jgi:hypothetical protein
MSAVWISLIVFACVFAGALLGLGLRAILPEPHRSGESKDMVRAGTGLIATISALVLGLLVASAKGAYDTQKDEVTTQAAKTALLDRILLHYGPETKQIRRLLRESVAQEIERVWSPDRGDAPAKALEAGDVLYDQVQDLSPTTESQRGIKEHAIRLLMELGQTRWLMEAQRGSKISAPLLVVVIFWLTINFVSFGMFAPRNATVMTTLFVCALSVAGAVFLILEMSQPFQGVIQIPKAPMTEVLGRLGQ